MAGNPYLWSTTPGTNSASDPDINWVEGQAPGSVNDSSRAMMAGVAGMILDTNATLATTGATNSYLVTSNIAYPALATGIRLRVKAASSNTSACTLTLTPAGGAAFASKAIRVFGVAGEAVPVPGAIVTNGIYDLLYDSAANSAAGAWILLNPSNSGSTPIGGVLPYAGLTAPAGWLLCSGQNVSRTTYSALFNAIGTAYGVGDGSTTFGIPDIQARAIFGYDPSQATGRLTSAVTGVNSGTLGAAGGNQALQSHSHGVSDPTHTHTANVSDPGHTHSVEGASSQAIGGGGQQNAGAEVSISTGSNTTGITVANVANVTGITVTSTGAGASQNLPPAIILNHIIFAGA